MVAQRQPWVAWLYYQEARQLSTPAGFVTSTHLENRTAQTAGTEYFVSAAGIL